MTATLVNIRKLLAEVRQSLLEAQKAFNEQTKLLDKKDAELHASLNMLAVAALDECAALTIRAEQAEASAAAMREALRNLLAVVQDFYPLTPIPCECDPEVNHICETCTDRVARSEAARILVVKP